MHGGAAVIGRGGRRRSASTRLLDKVVEGGTGQSRPVTAVDGVCSLGVRQTESVTDSGCDVLERADGVMHHAQQPLLGAGRNLCNTICQSEL